MSIIDILYNMKNEINMTKINNLNFSLKLLQFFFLLNKVKCKKNINLYHFTCHILYINQPHSFQYLYHWTLSMWAKKTLLRDNIRNSYSTSHKLSTDRKILLFALLSISSGKSYEVIHILMNHKLLSFRKLVFKLRKKSTNSLMFSMSFPEILFPVA